MTKKYLNPNFFIHKRDKRQELFDFKKFKKSLEKSGLNEKMCDEIVEKVDPKKSYYKSTASLFRHTHNTIYKKSKKLAAHYNIKKSIFELGPTGYPFEILCSEIFKAKGFQTQVSVVKQGQFITHEIDVMAIRPDLTIMCECKFHSKHGHKDDVKLPLYIHSRFLDLQNTHDYQKLQYAILTNTDFSLDAIKYAEGVGLLLFSLNYPDKSTFLDLMKRYKVYPITILKNLKKIDAARLLKEKVVVLKHLKRHHLEKLTLPQEKISDIQKEIKELLQ